MNIQHIFIQNVVTVNLCIIYVRVPLQEYDVLVADYGFDI